VLFPSLYFSSVATVHFHQGISTLFPLLYGDFGYGDRNADGSRILDFADRLNLVICNILFMKQESQLATYAIGSVKSTVDYIIAAENTFS